MSSEEDKDYYLKVDRDNDTETVAILGNKKGLEYLKDCIEDLLEDRGGYRKRY